MALIEIQDFKKSFGNKVVHDGVNLFVREGECVGLIGGSGAGKSVILRSLIGLERPDSGAIVIDGQDITQLNEHDLVDVRRKVAYAFQGGALFDSMTVFENLAYPLREHTNMTEAEIAKRITEQLTEFGLDTATEKLYPSSLSGGMQKRVGLARAMMMNPKVILYDEPTAGLDPFNTKRIQEHILRVKAHGVTSILVTHDMPTAFAVCDKLSFLKHGRIVSQGTPEQLQKDLSSPIQQFINGAEP